MADTVQEGFSLSGLINQSIAEGKERKIYDSWWASALGGCPRSHFFKRLGVEPTSPPDERTERVFAVGNVFHEYVQDIADKKGFAFRIEEEMVDTELDLGGRADLIVLAEEKKILYDIKTINSRAFWHLENSGKTVKEKFPQYWKQLGAYMLMLKRAGTPVDEGRILLVSKDDLMLKEVTYFLTPELEQGVTDELHMLNKHWADKTLPDCVCPNLYLDKNGKSSGAKYCSYREEGSTTKCCDPKLAEGKLITAQAEKEENAEANSVSPG